MPATGAPGINSGFVGVTLGEAVGVSVAVEVGLSVSVGVGVCVRVGELDGEGA